MRSLYHWSEGGDAITNFSPARIAVYQRAIHEHGDPRLYIGAPTPYGLACDKALRFRSANGSIPDLTEFWRVFDRVCLEAKEQA